MQRFAVLTLVVIMAMGPTSVAAYSQADVDRMLAGDKNMQNADLSGITQINLTQRQYKNVDFSRADFRGSRMWGLVFDFAKMEGAKFDNGSFHNAHFHNVNLKGASLVNVDWSSVPAGGADFTGANLSGAKLTSAYLQTSKLIQANLSGADLSNSSLWRADLTGANLQGTVLANVEMEGAKIDQKWKNYIQGQSVRNLDKIEWIQRAPIKPQDLNRPAVDKKPRTPTVPLNR